MHTEPQVVFNPDLSIRSYVRITINGERHRFYNGNLIGLKCFPNKYREKATRIRLLNDLQYVLKKALEKGWLPHHPNAAVKETPSIRDAIQTILKASEKEEISSRYRRDMKRMGEAFLTYLEEKDLASTLLTDVSSNLVENFLQSFTTSGTYYMTQRSNLAGIFTRIVRKGWIAENTVYKTSLKRRIPILNTIFSKEELRAVLKRVELFNANLYLCVLMMYGCFLRPHREIRLLKRKHLNADCTTISLSGNENKSKRIRIIRLPPFITAQITRMELHLLAPEAYLITRSLTPANDDYFKTLWTRLKRDLVKKGMVTNNHTLYSFRHTGAVEVYQKTKDPYKVQQAMFHSSLAVTLVYLRSLGLLIDNQLEDLPDL